MAGWRGELRREGAKPSLIFSPIIKMGRLRGAKPLFSLLPPSFGKGRGIKGDGFLGNEGGGLEKIKRKMFSRRLQIPRRCPIVSINTAGG
jgi:hypothetical protein